ncbi:MAG: ATP-binding protein [Kiritimatiellia bacterium]
MQINAEKSWHVPNRMEALAEAAKEIFAWLGTLPLSSRAKYFAGLAVEEIVTNTIKYGFDDNSPHVVDVRISVDRNHLILVFEDDGHPFDPTSRPPPNIEALVESQKIGGLGIELVRRMCEIMAYERKNNVNRLVLRIRRFQPDDTQFLSLSSLL